MSTTSERLEKNVESAAEQLVRHTDPAYSLEKSKEEWYAAVEKLQAYVVTKGEDENPYKFTLTIEDLVNDVNHALQQVQEDVRRVSAGENLGWVDERSISRYARRGYSRVKSNQFDDGFGDDEG